MVTADEEFDGYLLNKVMIEKNFMDLFEGVVLRNSKHPS